MKKVLKILAIVLLSLGALAAAFFFTFPHIYKWHEDSMRTLKLIPPDERPMAPDFSFDEVNQKAYGQTRFRLSDFRGKTVVIWANIKNGIFGPALNSEGYFAKAPNTIQCVDLWLDAGNGQEGNPNLWDGDLDHTGVADRNFESAYGVAHRTPGNFSWYPTMIIVDPKGRVAYKKAPTVDTLATNEYIWKAVQEIKEEKQ